MKLKKDNTKRELGWKVQTCKICGARGKFKTWLVQEMMQGTKDQFSYFACDRCQCLQIASVPDNLGNYYGNDYYSYQVAENSDKEFAAPVTKMTKILDVGCGAGVWLLHMAEHGYGNLYGCDPFLEKDRNYGDRVTIRSCSIHEMEGEGTFDLIHMSDSFEHMTDPLNVLKSVCRLLKEDGVLDMTIPTYPNIAFDQFGPYWYQIDAPRHIFLHSKQSLSYLAAKSNLIIQDICYNSNNSQFIRSYFYEHGILFWEQKNLIYKYFSVEKIGEMDRASVAANEQEYGDHMHVLWKKNPVFVKEGKKVIFLRFPKNRGRRDFLYPPVYRDENTDYVCFTDDKTLTSTEWQIQLIENPLTDDLEPYLKKYNTTWEIKPNQIQMGSLWNGYLWENLVTVPALEELPGVQLDFDKFEPTLDANGKYRYRKNPDYHDGKYNGRPLLLTIGVPVSNQIDTIDKCLFHIKPLLEKLDSELLVIDTGSTDGTLEICRRYDARIISHPWHDNMSAVRNEGIYHARGQWYLSIDDDEWFENVDAILHFFQNEEYKKCNVAMYTQRNYVDQTGEKYDDLASLRLAEITQDLHFEGRIHDAMVVEGHKKGILLDAYTHHYGFVRGDVEKERAKAKRNMAILPYDIYEYPEDVRYLFQLGKECGILMGKEISIKLLIQTIALSKLYKNNQYGKNSAMIVFYELYTKADKRLLWWAKTLQELFSFTWAEQAAIAWYQEVLSEYLKKPACKVIQYYQIYEKMLAQYHKDPTKSRMETMHGLAFVDKETLIMDAMIIAYEKYIVLGEEDKAAKVLCKISLEGIGEKRTRLLEKGFVAGDKLFDVLCAHITDMQWEEWGNEILNLFVLTLRQEAICTQQRHRLRIILEHISVDTIIEWVESHERKYKGESGVQLITYALALDIEKASTQELCIASWMLKEEYINKRESVQGDSIFRQYILVTGAFAVRYYGEELLIDANNCAIAPDIRAAYRMAVVLLNGNIGSESVVLLRQALTIFPPFYEEIRKLLLMSTNG